MQKESVRSDQTRAHNDAGPFPTLSGQGILPAYPAKTQLGLFGVFSLSAWPSRESKVGRRQMSSRHMA
eukprot:2911415-Prymnesium_polylepis.1